MTLALDCADLRFSVHDRPEGGRMLIDIVRPLESRCFTSKSPAGPRPPDVPGAQFSP